MAAESDDREWRRFSPTQRALRALGVGLAVAAFVVSWRALDINYEYAATAPRETYDLLSRMYPPDLGYVTEILPPLIETIHISILGTAFAVLISLPIAFLAAENTSPNRATYYLGKFIVSFTRSVNVIIWALIFVVLFGSGALAGVLAIAVRSIGFTAKLIAEGIEEIDHGQVEAIRATGASPFQVLMYAIAPQIKPAFVGVSTYRWDINVRASTIIGFVGAGGIGVALTTSINSFAWDNVLTILIAILGVVVFSEVFSAYMRRKVR
ncbi:phosphonate ABC transporter, permease protein PhnE [Halorussus marinus]|uniref:phosphonate ABC transporter, permease protein PhnE n=1 Tax=Halorussus marinus TaxID=2505976 RepID=UPI001092EBA6|nr:phosphonate ABC transporter, permease protein PhnE [Halorussus marinus]